MPLCIEHHPVNSAGKLRRVGNGALKLVLLSQAGGRPFKARSDCPVTSVAEAMIAHLEIIHSDRVHVGVPQLLAGVAKSA